MAKKRSGTPKLRFNDVGDEFNETKDKLERNKGKVSRRGERFIKMQANRRAVNGLKNVMNSPQESSKSSTGTTSKPQAQPNTQKQDWKTAEKEAKKNFIQDEKKRVISKSADKVTQETNNQKQSLKNAGTSQTQNQTKSAPPRSPQKEEWLKKEKERVKNFAQEEKERIVGNKAKPQPKASKAGKIAKGLGGAAKDLGKGSAWGLLFDLITQPQDHRSTNDIDVIPAVQKLFGAGDNQQSAPQRQEIQNPRGFNPNEDIFMPPAQQNRSYPAQPEGFNPNWDMYETPLNPAQQTAPQQMPSQAPVQPAQRQAQPVTRRNIAQAINPANDPSVVNQLNRQGMDSSYANRARMAQEMGIDNYRGTAEQNLEMLSRLRNPIQQQAPEIQPVQPLVPTIPPRPEFTPQPIDVQQGQRPQFNPNYKTLDEMLREQAMRDAGAMNGQIPQPQNVFMPNGEKVIPKNFQNESPQNVFYSSGMNYPNHPSLVLDDATRRLNAIPRYK